MSTTTPNIQIEAKGACCKQRTPRLTLPTTTETVTVNFTPHKSRKGRTVTGASAELAPQRGKALFPSLSISDNKVVVEIQGPISPAIQRLTVWVTLDGNPRHRLHQGAILTFK